LEAAGQGSLGGYREGIMQAERERNLERQLGDVYGAGMQQAYGQAQQARSRQGVCTASRPARSIGLR